MFRQGLTQTNHDELSGDKLKNLEKLKLKAEEVVRKNNDIVNRIWTIDHQLNIIDFKNVNNIVYHDEKNQLLKSRRELEILLKNRHYEREIKNLYSQIEKIEKELNHEFVREPFFTR
jgi:hypothetical protein